MLRYLTYIITLMHCLLHSAPAAAQAEFSRADVLADLKETAAILQRVHPNLTAHRSRSDLDTRFSSIRNSVGEQSTFFEAAAHIQKMLASVCDGHTGITGRYLTTKIQPSMLGLMQDILIARNGKLTLFDGRIVEQLNEIDGKDALQALLSLNPWDGCAKGDFFAPLYVSPLPEFLFSHWVGLDPAHQAKLRRRDDDSAVDKRLRGTFATTFFNTRMRRNRETITALPGMLQRNGMDFASKWTAQRAEWDQNKLLIAFSQDNKTAYFRIEQFLETDEQRQAVADIMRKIIKKDPEHLILDLSGNPGGWIDATGHLMSFLLRRAHRPAVAVRMRDTKFDKRGKFTYLSKQRQRASRKSVRQFRRVKPRNGTRLLRYTRRRYGNPSFNGRLTIMVGPRTFSAATMAVTTLRTVRRAPTRVVGLAMGGSNHTSCFAASGYYTLPRTKLQIAVPSMCYDRQRGKRRPDDTLRVDVPVNPHRGSLYLLRNDLFKAAFDTSAGW
ncbi:MAG: S41 family peptidase [Pseudomonadota bacterium]